MFNNDWDIVLKDELQESYFKQLLKFINNEYNLYTVYPRKEDIFRAFLLTPYSKTRVVILGQDPYHNGSANGLCFSSKDIPPSLRNIYKEMKSDIGDCPQTGDLTSWAKQGVLLLNTVLTVRAGTPNSHSNIGWERFTDAVIKKLSERDVIFLLWGKKAQSKIGLLNSKSVLTAAHPSPLSVRGFLGCKHFSKVNTMLKDEIKWV